jgi:PAS domain S-box-containing protein
MTEEHHILIVEDSMTQAFSLEYLLSESGYKVAIATNGLQALEMAHLHKPDLVISDITMPIMGGFEFCSRAKSDPGLRDVPIVLLTDLSNPDDIIHGLEARADGYITKPYEEGFLLSKIRSLLARRHEPTTAEEEAGEAIEFSFAGEKHVITASRKHILDMFISTYEHSMAQKRILEQKQGELNDINARLASSIDNLKMSEERFRSLVETVPDIVYRLDSDGRFSFLNSAIERLGYHRGELIGTHFSEIISPTEVHAVSWQSAVGGRPESVPSTPPKLFDERRSGQRMTAGLEVRLKTKSGVTVEHGEVKPLSHSPLVVEISSSGLYGEGSEMRRNYVGTVGVIRDITDRKKAQDALQHEREFLEKLINAVPLPIFFVDTNGALQRANSALFRFFGLNARSTLGLRWHDFLPAETAERLAMGDLDGKDENIYEAVLSIAQGEERMVQVTKVRFNKSGEGVYGQIGVLIDVTERTRTETELRTAKRLADEATKAKSEFLATMSHELRTPLNAILGFSEMISMHALEGDDPSRYRDYAGSIYESGSHLLEIINDILDISAVEAGKLTLHPEDVETASLVEAAERLIQVRAEKRNLRLEVDLATAPCRLRVDKRRLKQILINLLGNAVKFTPKGGEITLQVHGTPEGGVCFVVADNGIGMDAEGIAKALTLFGQVDSRLARKYEGTGLGLPLSQHLAESLGGGLQVTSVLGRGTTVTVTLPPECVIP